MAQAVSYQPLTTEAYVQTQASPCWMCSELRETGTGYSVYSSFCMSGTFHYSFIHSFLMQYNISNIATVKNTLKICCNNVRSHGQIL
jgi:hypothetical protein